MFVLKPRGRLNWLILSSKGLCSYILSIASRRSADSDGPLYTARVHSVRVILSATIIVPYTTS